MEGGEIRQAVRENGPPQRKLGQTEGKAAALRRDVRAAARGDRGLSQIAGGFHPIGDFAPLARFTDGSRTRRSAKHGE